MHVEDLRGARAWAAGVFVAMLILGVAFGSRAWPLPAQAPIAQPTTSASPTDGQPSAPVSPVNTHSAQIAEAKSTSIQVSDTEGGPVASALRAADVLTSPGKTPLVFLVKQITPLGIEVYLPIRPNGSTGWISSADVTLYSTEYAIDVYLTDHRLVVSEAGIQLAEYPIATGRDGLPTPGGVYFLRELLQPPNPNGLYGPYAYGLSGYSPVLDSFASGDAVIGIHGTNEPDKIGTDVSHGCIRLLNEDVTQMVEVWQLPLGAPVYIHE